MEQQQQETQFIGDKIAGFDVVELIGTGAMASVYRAFDTELERDVALKIPDLRYSDNTSFKNRFNCEAKAMARLHHRNIVQIFSVGEHNGVPYLAMEFVKGAPLSKILADRDRIEIDEALEYILQVCDAMECAHQADVVHRDLKPGNILVESSGRVLVADFGISKIMSGDTEDDTLTFIGTPTYMSPEQCGEGKLDQRTDIYSLGVILYEMILGHPPFGGANPAEIIKSHLMETPGFPTEPGKELPPNIVKILRKMLAKDPEQRYRDVRSLRNEIDMWKKWAVAKSAGKVQDTLVSESAPLILAFVPQKILLGAVSAALKNIDHRMVVVANSTELLSKLSNLPAKMVILSHENGKNGVFKVAERIKEAKKDSELKVMLLSHGISRGEVESAFLSGVNDIIAEPFDPSVLISKLESALVGVQRSVECRRFFRKEMSDNITIRIENEILDISEGGMRIATNMALKIGEILRFELQLFRELGFGEKTGRVVWISRNEDGDGFAYQAGLDFADFTKSERDRLRKWIFASEIGSRNKAKAAIDRTPDMGPQLRTLHRRRTRTL
jgi:serine/threonine protein kinase